jgi:hypothetical protein
VLLWGSDAFGEGFPVIFLARLNAADYVVKSEEDGGWHVE